MNDFNGETYEFAAGSLLGMRSWQIDTKGRLRGVSHTAIWRPGENVAECRAAQRLVPCPKAALRDTGGPDDWCPCGCGLTLSGDDLSLMECEPCDVEGCSNGTHPAPRHDFDPECGCGFWAYDDHTFKPHGDVTGIIEGYGKTTIGTKGFRCEKAKIVALCRQRPIDDRQISLSSWTRLQKLYPEVTFYDTADEMVLAHDEVMHSWDSVEDGFWDEPTGVLKVDLTGSMLSFTTAMQGVTRAMVNPSFARGGPVPPVTWNAPSTPRDIQRRRRWWR